MRKATRSLLLIGAVLACLIALACGICIYLSKPYDLRGPDSPGGLRVVAHVSDCGIGWGADFNTDVEVTDQAGRVVARWNDQNGQYPQGGPERLVRSMKWLDASVLEFESSSGMVKLQVQQTQAGGTTQQPATAGAP